MRIGELSRLTGTKVDTIRHYEREGLLQAPPRTGAGYRVYGPPDAERLHFIRRCRSLDMNLAEVRALLGLQGDTQCADTRALLDAHIDHVADRIAALQQLKQELHALRARCQGNEPACAILEGLAEPGAALPPKSHVGHSH